MPKKEWQDAKTDAGKYAPYIQKLQDAIAQGTTPAARETALIDQLALNAKDMIAAGATIDDLLAGGKHMLKFAEHYRKVIAEGV